MKINNQITDDVASTFSLVTRSSSAPVHSSRAMEIWEISTTYSNANGDKLFVDN